MYMSSRRCYVLFVTVLSVLTVAASESSRGWDGDSLHGLYLSGPETPANALQTRNTAELMPLPMRGPLTFSQPDYANSNFSEDALLEPMLGNALLHLDVPFSSDVTITYVSGNMMVNHEVRGRGRYRDLLLTGLFANSRQPVDLVVTWRGTTPRFKQYKHQLKRTVQLQAGDRRHLAIREAEFEKSVANVSTIVVVSQGFSVPTAAVDAKGVNDGAECDEPSPPKCHKFEFDTAQLTAFVGYSKLATDGGEAVSFTFANVNKTPDLVLAHEPPDPSMTVCPGTKVTITVQINWQGLEEPVHVELGSVCLDFQYDDSKMRGTATIPFMAPESHEKVEKAILAKLSFVDRPKTMAMSGVITLGSLKMPVGGAITIGIIEGEP